MTTPQTIPAPSKDWLRAGVIVALFYLFVLAVMMWLWLGFTTNNIATIEKIVLYLAGLISGILMFLGIYKPIEK